MRILEKPKRAKLKDEVKSMGVLFHFACFTVELRNDNDKLVGELCLINSELGYDVFESGRSSYTV
jgi:hypothetical protein